MTSEDYWLTRPEVSERLRVPVKTLAVWASQRKGPRYALFGKHARYRLSDVIAWEEQQFTGGAALIITPSTPTAPARCANTETAGGRCNPSLTKEKKGTSMKRQSTVNLANVPVPAGFEADEWENDAIPNRVLWGQWRDIDGVDHDRVSISPSAIQLSDGRIDDGSQYEPPHVHLRDDCLTPKQARDLAAALIESADELDRLVASE